MKEIVLITGGRGLIATHLSTRIQKNFKVRFLTRNVKYENDYLWDISRSYIDNKALQGVSHIIHLAGADISGKRWTKKYKNEILGGRINSAKLLLNALKELEINIKSFISASAVGYYGTKTTNHIYTEEDDPDVDFLSDVVVRWEGVADEFNDCGIANRVVKVRTGVVLAQNGGALPKMVFPIRLSLGAVLGSENQYMPWIHINDICAIYEFTLKNNLNGAFNACATEHVTNKEITEKIGKVLKKEIFLSNISKFIIRLIWGKSSIVILEGSRISNRRIIDSGFRFEFNDLDYALENLIVN